MWSSMRGLTGTPDPMTDYTHMATTSQEQALAWDIQEQEQEQALAWDIHINLCVAPWAGNPTMPKEPNYANCAFW